MSSGQQADGGAAFDINDRGVVAGLVSSGSFQEAVLWQPDGTLTALPAGPCPPGVIGPCLSQGYATAINNRGDAAGESVQNATVWEAGGGIRSLATEDVQISLAWDINDRGTAVGAFDFDRNGPLPRAAFVWEEGKSYMNLGPLLGAEESQALAVNKKGAVVGLVNESATEGHAFLWSESSGVVVLPKPAGAEDMEAFGINDRGDIVGVFFSNAEAFRDGFLWNDRDGLRPFSSLMPDSGWRFLEVLDINDKGQIVGKGLNPQGQVRGFLLDPRSVSEPQPLVLIIFVLLCLYFFRRRLRP